jgi:hypothetical protein
MNSGDGSASRLAVTDNGDAHCPSVDAGWCRFVELPEFFTLLEVGMQLLDNSLPFWLMRL